MLRLESYSRGRPACLTLPMPTSMTSQKAVEDWGILREMGSILPEPGCPRASLWAEWG